MKNTLLPPPLRLILNTACNGSCPFCHHEGCSQKDSEMPFSVIRECIEAAKELNICKINLSGGEPTLRSDLGQIVSLIKSSLPDIQLSLTSNGYKLRQLPDEVLNLIDHINISISSLDEEIYRKYQNVEPVPVMDALRRFVSKTTMNIVVVPDNCMQIEEIIAKCLSYGFNVELMFDITANDILLQKQILSLLTQKYGLFQIAYRSTPVLVASVANQKIRIKLPAISNIQNRIICSQCPIRKYCTEKICGLRVYPNGDVTPCLNGYIQAEQPTVFEKIMNLYPQLGVDENDIYSFFFDEKK